MRRVTFLALPLALAACGGSTSQGQALFEANCAMCHGTGARGDGPMAEGLPIQPPSILEHLGHHTEDQLIRLVQAGIPPAMPPAPITADEIRLAIEYVWTLLPEDQQVAMRAMRDSVAAGLLAPGMPGMQGMPGMGGMSAPMDSSKH
jgi:mono/diheme cytochrome c family protein